MTAAGSGGIDRGRDDGKETFGHRSFGVVIVFFKPPTLYGFQAPGFFQFKEQIVH
jgi:hypothetical protein